MAKLSLWLLTLAKDKPFEFLDHAIRCGDSLVGLHDLEQLRHYSLKPDDDDAMLFKGPLDNAVDEAINLRLKLEDMPANTVEDIEAQEKLLKKAEEKIARLRCAADLLVAAEFCGENVKDKQERVRHAAVVSGHYVEKGPTEEFEEKAAKERRGQLMFHWPLEFPEVIVKQGGFDAFIGNPPFVGGRRIRSTLGVFYLRWITEVLFTGTSGNADLCSFFVRRAFQQLAPEGVLGLVATNTISQADTREVGLDPIVRMSGRLLRATSSRAWPGDANITIAEVWITKRTWNGECVLDKTMVDSISPYLVAGDATVGPPQRLTVNREKSFQGSVTVGMGFVLSRSEAEALLATDVTSKDVIFPYLNGSNLNSDPHQLPSRRVISFNDWPLNEDDAVDDYDGRVAADYPSCLAIVEERVRPERTRRKENGEYTLRSPLPQKWWIYGDKRPALYRAIAQLKRALVASRVSKTLIHAWVPNTYIYSDSLVVFATDQDEDFALLSSSIHSVWAWSQCSTMRNAGIRYSPTDAVETFAHPRSMNSLCAVGRRFDELRNSILHSESQGLTTTYNQLHDPGESSEDIQNLRELHVEMDQAVATAYGWDDLDLGHGFHETKQGLRYTISEPARREVLQRLLKLNHERYKEEAKQGLHDKKKGKGKKPGTGKGRKKKVASGPTLPGFDDDEEGG